MVAAKEKVRPYYPDDPSSIPRIAQVWLHKPVSPLVVPDVFARRRNFVNSDLHVLLVDADKGERFQQKLQLEGLGYQVSSAPSGAAAKELLGEHGGELPRAAAALEGPDGRSPRGRSTRRQRRRRARGDELDAGAVHVRSRHQAGAGRAAATDETLARVSV